MGRRLPFPPKRKLHSPGPRHRRRAGIPIVYLQMGFKPDLSNSGGPESLNWHEELALLLMNSRPELKGKLLVEGTWDFANVDELTPRSGIS